MPGILHARSAREHFRYADAPPSPDLAPFVEHFWIIHWDLTGRPAHTQWVLPYPSVNMTFTSTGRCRVAGVPHGRFAETLRGAGRVAGVRFRPGGFRPFLDRPVAAVTGRFVPVGELYGETGRALSERVLTAGDADAVLVATAVDRAAADPAITRVGQLAAASGVGMRRLQRLFRDHVGVGPKWVIRRCRLHDAADRAANGGTLDLPALAAELGYSDQAHLTRDFTALIGEPPARYARRQ